MKKIIVILAAVATCITAGAQEQWTLQQCLDYALQHNITLQKARLQKQIAVEDVKSAQSALLPSLSASTNQSVGYRPWQNSGTTTVTNGVVNSKVDKAYYNGSYGVNASWTVWNGNRNRNQLKLSRIEEHAQELSYAESANSIQERIAQLYVQILYLSEALKVSEQSLETSKKNEERGQQMYEVGKMSKADLAQLTAQRASDEYSIVEAQSNIQNYTLQLKQLLEITDQTPFAVASAAAPDERALAQIPSLASVYEQALNSRPEIENSRLAVKSSDIQEQIAKAGRLPQVNMSGGIGTSSNSLSNRGWGSQMKTNFDASAGVSISVPIFDQRQTRTAVNKARLQRQSYMLDLQEKEKQLYQTIEQYWLDATTNQQKFKTACTTEESEQMSYDLLSEQFRLGLKNIVELMTGKDRLLQAQQNKLQSKYMTLLNMQMLKFYAGNK